MNTSYLLKRLTYFLLGISLAYSSAALGSVTYNSTSSFSLSYATGNPNQDFGTVQIQSDNPNGWVLKVRSAQAGNLAHASHPSTIPYTLTVNGILVGNLASGTDVEVMTTSTLTCETLTGCTFPVQATISANNVNGKPAGHYSDTLVFSLVNK